MLTRSKVMCVGKRVFHTQEFFNYVGTNKNVLATQDELTKAPWDTMTITTSLLARAHSMKFFKPFVKLSECAPHVKEIIWRDDLVNPRLSWPCTYLPKVWIKLDKEARKLTFLMDTHARLGQGTRVASRQRDANAHLQERFSLKSKAEGVSPLKSCKRNDIT